jgi:hypothetical protein
LIDLICQYCGSFLASLPAERGETVTVRCPSCGKSLEFEVLDPYATWNAPPEGGREDRSDPLRDDARGGWSTLFHPGSLPTPREDPESDDPAAGVSGSPAGSVVVAQGTLLLKRQQLDLPPQPFEVEAFFLVPREETAPRRIPVKALLTTFGRAGADVELDDEAVSGRHFQVETLGREVFIRDLDSRNGTFLNGRSIRYCELRPGDEVLAGRTVLIFRTSE